MFSAKRLNKIPEVETLKSYLTFVSYKVLKYVCFFITNNKAKRNFLKEKKSMILNRQRIIKK